MSMSSVLALTAAQVLADNRRNFCPDVAQYPGGKQALDHFLFPGWDGFMVLGTA